LKVKKQFTLQLITMKLVKKEKELIRGLSWKM
jgi:hypothetical protein